MKLTFDQSKDASNLAKHGVSMSEAEKLEWDALMAMPDNRADYGEVRMIGFAPVLDRVFCVVYTDRGDERRIISLRKANNREVLRYANKI